MLEAPVVLCVSFDDLHYCVKKSMIPMTVTRSPIAREVDAAAAVILRRSFGIVRKIASITANRSYWARTSSFTVASISCAIHCGLKYISCKVSVDVPRAGISCNEAFE
ncbi:hypothetical protein PsorP6_014472 [Peronosclerospora sorghi]|uniref:Uncharacterized protein n=1 Tax=Peronosclerospora sorghi TaxID=230839 RepID=A0ACC0VRV8_9STRA|nr:hypothetical protein PsorP6_014472 [Peronosclerospora sorghi]